MGLDNDSRQVLWKLYPRFGFADRLYLVGGLTGLVLLVVDWRIGLVVLFLITPALYLWKERELGKIRDKEAQRGQRVSRPDQVDADGVRPFVRPGRRGPSNDPAESTIDQVDIAHLAFFDLRPDEVPLEIMATFVPCAWPVVIPSRVEAAFDLPDEHQSWDQEFQEPYTNVLSPKQMDSETAVAEWQDIRDGAYAMRPQLCVALVTASRLLWRPVVPTGASPGSGDYTVYAEKSMGQRWIDLTDIEFITPSAVTSYNDVYTLPYRHHAVGAVFVTAGPGGVNGPSTPDFDYQRIGIAPEGLGRTTSLMVGWPTLSGYLDPESSPMVQAVRHFTVAMASAGVRIGGGPDPENFTRSRFPTWLPLSDRLTES